MKRRKEPEFGAATGALDSVGLAGHAEEDHLTARARADPQVRVGGDKVAEELMRRTFQLLLNVKSTHSQLVFDPQLELLLQQLEDELLLANEGAGTAHAGYPGGDASN
jgi:hypothetical protein